MRRPVGLADLAQCFAELLPADPASWSRIADALGFAAVAALAPEAAAPQPAPPTPPTPAAPTPAQQGATLQPAPTPEPQAPAAQEVASRGEPALAFELVGPTRAGAGDAAPQPPRWWSRLTALRERSEPAAAPQPAPLLLPLWARGTYMRTLTTPVPEGRLDIERLTELVARLEVPATIPRLPRLTMRRGLQVLVDAGESMLPFRADQRRLLREVQELGGGNVFFEVFLFRGTPARWSRPLVNPRGLAGYELPPHGTPILALSDLGIGALAAGQPYVPPDDWLDLARAARSAACQLTAYVPYHPGRCPPALHRELEVVHWHHARGLETLAAGAGLAEPASLLDDLRRRNPHAAALAHLASLASRVELSLLRELRLGLLPAADGGAEADLWFSSLVATRSDQALLLHTDQAEALRRALFRADPGLFRKAWRLVQDYRRRTGAFEGTMLEEEINYWLAQTGRLAAARVQLLLRRVVKTVWERGAQDAGGVAVWSVELLDALPAAARNSAAGRDLGVAAGFRLDPRYLPEGVLPDDLAGRQWLIPVESTNLPSVDIWVARTPAGLFFSGAGDPLPDGKRLAGVPATAPVVLWLSWGGGRRKVSLEPGRRAGPVDTGQSAVTIETFTGATWTLTPTVAAAPAEPAPAQATVSLDLSGQGLDAVHDSIFTTPLLSALDLSRNRLTVLPARIAELAGLEELILDGNQLSALPPEIGDLAALTTLRAADNRLAELPEELGQLARLQELDLRNNALAGLPRGLGRLRALRLLDLRGNPIAEGDGELARAINASWQEPAAILAAYERARAADTPLERADPGEGELLRRYLERLADETVRYVRLDADPAGAGLSLMDIYVPLDVVERGPEAGQRRPALAALAEHRRLILLGAPGFGKTTFVSHLAGTLARANLSPAEGWLQRLGAEWSHGSLLPVLVSVPDLAAVMLARDPGAAAPDLLWQYLGERHGPEVAAALRRLARAGEVLFLLDGLDASGIESEGRTLFELDNTLERLSAELGDGGRILATCRTRAFQGRLRGALDWPTVELAPLTQEQMRSFVKARYAGLAQAGRLTTEQVVTRGDELIDALLGSPQLAALAGSPLLLSYIVTLHASTGQLPNRAPELYEGIVELLLRPWMEQPMAQQSLEPSGWLEQIRSLVRPLHDRLAYEAHAAAERGAGALTGDTVRRVLESVFEAAARGGLPRERIPELTTRCLQFIRDEGGLFVEVGEDRYAFAHQVLQEYCAGSYIALRSDDPVGQVLRRRAEGWWAEPVKLAAALLRPQNLTALLGALIDRAEAERPKPAPRRFDDLVLAAEIGATSGWERLRAGAPERAPQLGAELGHALAAALADPPPGLPAAQRIRAGLLLGDLGDPRVPVTPDEWRSALQPTQPEPSSSGDGSLFARYFCRVEAGAFVMGSADDEPGALDDERPRHEASLAAPLWVARHPITNAQWRVWVEQGGRPSRFAGDPNLSRPNQPVTGVSWAMAAEYCDWLSARIGVRVRLPREAEWEAAARGRDGRRYPWSDEWLEERAACAADREARGWPTTVPVGCYPAGAAPCGALDMSGNVWEWTADLFQSYPGATSPFRREGAIATRGGGYDSEPNRVRCAARDERPRWSSEADNCGFRVVVGGSDDEELWFEGVDATTGAYARPPTRVSELQDEIAPSEPPENLRELRAKARSSDAHF